MTQPLLEWSDDFLIGIRELDYEHKILIEDINKFHAELLEHAGKDNIEDTLGGIHARMQAHFALEENFMKRHDYPHLVAHKAEHNRLLDDYTEYMIRFKRGDGEEWGIMIGNILKDWIVNHILVSDKKMAMMAE